MEVFETQKQQRAPIATSAHHILQLILPSQSALVLHSPDLSRCQVCKKPDTELKREKTVLRICGLQQLPPVMVYAGAQHAEIHLHLEDNLPGVQSLQSKQIILAEAQEELDCW